MKVTNFILKFFGVAIMLVVMAINNNIAAAHPLHMDEKNMAMDGWFITDRSNIGNVTVACKNGFVESFTFVKGYKLTHSKVILSFRNNKSYHVIRNTACVVRDYSHKNIVLHPRMFMQSDAAIKHTLKLAEVIHPSQCDNPLTWIRPKDPYEWYIPVYTTNGQSQNLTLIMNGRIATAVVDACR